jgi:predicted Rdx family selenoprotein
VTLENEVIFAKKREGRFPLPGEVEERIEERVSAGAKEGPFTV